MFYDCPGQRGGLDQFDDDPEPVVLLGHVIDPYGIGVVDTGTRAGLAQRALPPDLEFLGSGGVEPQFLRGDRTVEQFVGRAPDTAHAALSDGFKEPVPVHDAQHACTPPTSFHDNTIRANGTRPEIKQPPHPLRARGPGLGLGLRLRLERGLRRRPYRFTSFQVAGSRPMARAALTASPMRKGVNPAATASVGLNCVAAER